MKGSTLWYLQAKGAGDRRDRRVTVLGWVTDAEHTGSGIWVLVTLPFLFHMWPLEEASFIVLVSSSQGLCAVAF
jgi:hypothetical protein